MPRLVHPHVIRTLKQTGRRHNISIDASRKAILPGKRISRTGHTYWETRKNRSDNRGSRL